MRRKTKIKDRVQTPEFIRMVLDFTAWITALGYSASMQQAAPRMISEYLHWLEQHVYFSKTPDLASYKQFMGYFENRPNMQTDGSLSVSHINKQISVMNLFFRFLQLSGQLQELICLNQIKENRILSRVILSRQQIAALYDATQDDLFGMRDRAMLSVYYGCGLRRSEGLRLELSDVNFDVKLLKVQTSKNGKGRLVPLSEGCLKHLRTYIYEARPLLLNATKPTDLLFLSERGEGLNEQTFGLRLHKLQAQSGDIELQQMKFSTHALRHSIATHLMEAGMELDMIGTFLGHQNLDSTQLYTHFIKG